MTPHRTAPRALGGIAAALALAACSPSAGPSPGPGPVPEPRAAPVPRAHTGALPPIAPVRAALAFRVVHPTPDTPRPRTDSAYIYGSVGSGDAYLTIDGVPVQVEPNGAFLAWLPVPQDGTWRLRAERDGQTVEHALSYRAPAAPSATAGTTGAAEPTVFGAPITATVTGGADTVATGSDAAYMRATPTGTYRWFLPRGARLTALERRGDQLRVRLDGGTEAWIPANVITLTDAGPVAPVRVAAPQVRPAERWVDVRVAAGSAPFLVETAPEGVTLTVYGAAADSAPARPVPDALVRSAGWETAGGSARLRIATARPVWGWKAFYERDGTLVLRLRRPPRIDAARPLSGIRIVVDPGHPPGGAIGPTGMTEAEANLAISLPLAEMLRAGGAEVILTRTTNAAVELGERPAMAVRADADLLISVHNNAFGEGVNPFRNHGTSTYHFHPLSAPLARALDREIVAVTRLPDLGARVSNLALVRPTWMPTTLTESMFMLFPEQENALRDPAFVRRLAEAHVRGIEAFLRERAADGASATTGTTP